jgi:chromosomal replication initiation ATPase DnaA
MTDLNPWQTILDQLRLEVDPEDYRRWFDGTAYASDSGDQITVWVLSESIRQHLATHHGEAIRRALRTVGREDTQVRFVVGGYDEDDDDES